MFSCGGIAAGKPNAARQILIGAGDKTRHAPIDPASTGMTDDPPLSLPVSVGKAMETLHIL
jgi:hypothetical protein